MKGEWGDTGERREKGEMGRAENGEGEGRENS